MTYTGTIRPVPPSATYTDTIRPVPPSATYTDTIRPVPPSATYADTINRILSDLHKNMKFSFECEPINEKLLKTNKTFSADKIKNVEFYPPAVKMTFTDGTVTTAVAQEGDEYDPKTGMMVCIMKYVWQSVNYNTALDKWIKKDRERDEKQEALQKAREEEKARKQKEQEKVAQRKAKKREEAIEIQKEAYLRAMKEIHERAAE